MGTSTTSEEANTAQKVAETYNTWGEGYDDVVQTTPFFINSFKLYDSVLARLIAKNRRFRSVLDMGCGSGLQSAALSPYADTLVGVDLSTQLLHIARKRCKDAKHLYFQVADACKLPFRESRFDLIISYGDVLSHIVDHYEQAISEMARVAKPGAIVTFEVDTKWNVGLLYHPRELRDALMTPGNGHATRIWGGMRFKTFTYPEMVALLGRYGLSVIGCYGHNILASFIPDRFLLEQGRRSLFGQLALTLGRIDLGLCGMFPWNRFGFNLVIVAEKIGGANAACCKKSDTPADRQASEMPISSVSGLLNAEI